jgi:hypothetical protein
MRAAAACFAQHFSAAKPPRAAQPGAPVGALGRFMRPGMKCAKCGVGIPGGSGVLCAPCRPVGAEHARRWMQQRVDASAASAACHQTCVTCVGAVPDIEETVAACANTDCDNFWRRDELKQAEARARDEIARAAS